MVANETTGYVYQPASALTRDALARILKGRFGNAWAIVRRADDVQVLSLAPGRAEPLLGKWTQAQIFNPDAELRWRKTVQGYEVLLLTENEAPPAEFRRPSSRFVVVSPSFDATHGFFLWGTKPNVGRKDNIWWEARVPPPLHYPGKLTKKPPRLAYRLYLDGATVRWVRLVEVKSDAGD